jgi:hypothetical protein
MNRTLGAWLRVGSAASATMVTMFLLVACLPGPATTPLLVASPAVSKTVASTRTPRATFTQPMPTHTPEATPTQPAPDEAVVSTLSAPGSPLAIPTRGSSATGEEVSRELATDFTLDSAQGIAVTLSDYQGKSNVVLVFYRGMT